MPEIGHFFGVVVRMYYREHAPPHFHVRYGEHSAVVDIATARIEGELHARASRRVLQWYFLHRSDVLENWNRASRSEPLQTIEPLE